VGPHYLDEDPDFLDDCLEPGLPNTVWCCSMFAIVFRIYQSIPNLPRRYSATPSLHNPSLFCLDFVEQSLQVVVVLPSGSTRQGLGVHLVSKLEPVAECLVD
jgi:hypothetical protein